MSPGSLKNSVLFERIRQDQSGRMPPLATQVLDERAIEMLREWIEESLPVRQSYLQWQTEIFPGEPLSVVLPFLDPDGDGATNRLEYWTGTDPRRADDFWKIEMARLPGGGYGIRFRQQANRRFQVQWSDSLGGAEGWTPLDVPENRVFFSAQSFWKTVPLPDTGTAARFYRVEVGDRNR